MEHHTKLLFRYIHTHQQDKVKIVLVFYFSVEICAQIRAGVSEWLVRLDGSEKNRACWIDHMHTPNAHSTKG